MTRIVEIREQPVRLQAAIRNSLIDFSQMTVSVVAVITDRVVDGKPVVGLGFNSIGRYAQSGLLRDRFIPRLLADLDDACHRLSPSTVARASARTCVPNARSSSDTTSVG